LGNIWIPGWMPVQLLLILTAAFFAFVGIGWVLRKQGRSLPKFTQAVLVWVTAFIILRFVLYPPIPSALLKTYMGLITLVLFLLVSSDEESWAEFKRPILKTLGGDTPGFRRIRTVTFVALPLLIGFGTYNTVAPKFEEPIELRTVHPAPPASVKVHGKTFTLQTAENPFRVDESGQYSNEIQQQHVNDNPFDPDASKYMQYVREGGAIFFQNCHFCHGDNLDGRGMFAFAFNPIPANLADSGTIAQVQETFVFWRVSKGGPGLPREGFPWASAMPPWEQHLTTDEMWKAILFEYWHTGFYPRTWD
jgi:hypothetical protein